MAQDEIRTAVAVGALLVSVYRVLNERRRKR